MSLNFLGFLKNYPACRPAACKKLLQSQLGSSVVAKHQKIEGGRYGDFFQKKSHNAEILKGGTLWIIFNIHSLAKHQQI